MGQVLHGRSSTSFSTASRTSSPWLALLRRACLTWLESGGPAVETAMKPHSGADFIKRAIEYEFAGKVTFEMDVADLRCLIELPLGENVKKGQT